MNLQIYDPHPPYGNEYFTKMFAAPVRQYATANDIPVRECTDLRKARDSHVVLLTDVLSEELIDTLRRNGNRIIGFNVTDSSYISGAIRYAKNLDTVDKIFMVSGVPHTNEGSEIAVDNNFNVTTVPKPFLDAENWAVFDQMRKNGQLLSLPYVPWTPIPTTVPESYNRRSQKVILRGGGHARRILLSFYLMSHDLLDPNSGFVLHPYFADDMNPQFRFCDQCRTDFRESRRYEYVPGRSAIDCNSPVHLKTHPDSWDMTDLGQWNNRCPRSYYWMAEQYFKAGGRVDMPIVEKMLNARWLDPREYLNMLSRITFTSDLKWVHSIYQPQRFWEAASAGCINVLPTRATNQVYFPETLPGVHYMVYDETLKHLDLAFRTDEGDYNRISDKARRLYQEWIAPSVYPINTNLLAHIFNEMRKV